MQIVTTWNKQASVVKNTDPTLWSQTVRELNKRRHMHMWFLLFFLLLFSFFLLFAIRRRLRSHFMIRNSCFMFYRGFQTLENSNSTRPNGLGLSSVILCLETSVRHSHFFLKYYFTMSQFPWILIYYTLIKMHKPKPVGRPFISGCDGPTEQISSFVDSFLQPMAHIWQGICFPAELF